jgi:hypothetical protein
MYTLEPTATAPLYLPLSPPAASPVVAIVVKSFVVVSNTQGLTLVHFSAQLERFLGIGGAVRRCVARVKGVLGVV